MTERLSASELPESTRWVLQELDLIAGDGTVSRSHVRALGEFLVLFGGPSARPAVVATETTIDRPVRRRARTKPTKAEVRNELTMRISQHLSRCPGSTLAEIAGVLDAPLSDVTIAARPVSWLVLGDDEIDEPTMRVESDAIVATRDRARAALQAAHLMATPLSHQAYTTLVREGRVKGPSVARIVQLFGSWTAACTEVGVASGEPLRSHYERTWTRDDLVGFVVRFLRDDRFKGASHQFDVWRAAVSTGEKVPSLGTVRNIVGGTWGDIRTTALRQMRSEWAPKKR